MGPHVTGACAMRIAEPSCERRNEFLDRTLVVPTVENTEAAFFIEA